MSDGGLITMLVLFGTIMAPGIWYCAAQLERIASALEQRNRKGSGK